LTYNPLNPHPFSNHSIFPRGEQGIPQKGKVHHQWCPQDNQGVVGGESEKSTSQKTSEFNNERILPNRTEDQKTQKQKKAITVKNLPKKF